jgi:hypothetical protein
MRIAGRLLLFGCVACAPDTWTIAGPKDSGVASIVDSSNSATNSDSTASASFPSYCDAASCSVSKCNVSSDCPAGPFLCSGHVCVLITCTGSVIDGGCSNFGCKPGNPYCGGACDGGQCSECTDSRDCSDGSSTRSCFNGRCVDCMSDSQCPTDRPICNSMMRCVSCEFSGDCISNQCDPVSGTCNPTWDQ